MSDTFSLTRFVAILLKEFVQMRRDRLTFGMIIGIPILQLVLFGYAINSDPKSLPAGNPGTRIACGAIFAISGKDNDK